MDDGGDAAASPGQGVTFRGVSLLGWALEDGGWRVEKETVDGRVMEEEKREGSA